jgi:hypothetical protein
VRELNDVELERSWAPGKYLRLTVLVIGHEGNNLSTLQILLNSSLRLLLDQLFHLSRSEFEWLKSRIDLFHFEVLVHCYVMTYCSPD